MDDRFFIGRTTAYYEPDEDSIYVEDTWTWSEDVDDKDFVDAVYELNDDGNSELDWWLRSQRMNDYERNHSWNPDTRRPEQVWKSLITQATAIYIDGVRYERNQVEATDGLDMANKIEPLQISRYFDKYVYRKEDGTAMACYADDFSNRWTI